MTNKEQTISNLKKLKSFHNGSYGADIDSAIEALELLDKLDEIITKQIDISNNQVECQTLRWVLDVMSEMNVETSQGWISVSERLPEDGRPVLIYAWNVHHVIARYDSFRTENGYKNTWVTADAWNGNTEIKHDVIAWMPLPEIYKTESEG